MRPVTVTVPDDDPAEAAVRRVAEGLAAGFDPVVLRRPPGIADEHMPVLVARCSAILHAAAELPVTATR